MEMKYAFAVALALLSFAVGAYLYGEMPDAMATHWNASGQPDGYMPKFWGLFLIPLVSIGVILLFIAIPRIDPLKKNIEAFRNYYDWFLVLIVAFLLYVHMLALLFNLGFSFDFTRMLAPAFGVLFFYIGILTENAKRNWFVGIRTPWTLSSDVVWEKTHKLGGKLFRAVGLITFIGIILPEYAIWLMIWPLVAVALFLFVYSYYVYGKMN
jgi:uncharacterized membrane protein